MPAKYKRLLGLGGEGLGEPVDIGDGIYTVYCPDPFGNIIELCEIPVPEENPLDLPGVNKLDDFTGQ